MPFLGHDELQQAMVDADLVVCHGGPATILEARRHGHLPIVVPRDPARGEHVDDHQLLFARRLGAAGLVALCETREALHDALTAGLADPSRYAVAADPDAHEARRAAVARVGRIVDDLVAGSTPRPPRWRVLVPATSGHEGDPMTQQPSVSVVVPTRDRPELLRAAVRAILAQDYPGPIEAVVVFDQSASDESLTELATGPDRAVRVIHNARTPGLAGARNSGTVAAER